MARPKARRSIFGASGTNLQAIWKLARPPHSQPRDCPSALPTGRTLQDCLRAQDAGVATTVINHKDFADRPSFEQAINERLDEAGVELICLAGFMRLLTPTFVNHWDGPGD